MFSSIPRSLRKSTVQQVRRLAASFDGYGQHSFKGAVAAPYLEKAGLPKDTLDGTAWTTNGNADKVAAAVLEWAKDNGASVYCHWFQPQGAAGFRHGMTGQVQNTMLEFGRDGKPLWDFKGKNILKGNHFSTNEGYDVRHHLQYPYLVLSIPAYRSPYSFVPAITSATSFLHVDRRRSICLSSTS